MKMFKAVIISGFKIIFRFVILMKNREGSEENFKNKMVLKFFSSSRKYQESLSF